MHVSKISYWLIFPMVCLSTALHLKQKCPSSRTQNWFLFWMQFLELIRKIRQKKTNRTFAWNILFKSKWMKCVRGGLNNKWGSGCCGVDEAKLPVQTLISSVRFPASWGLGQGGTHQVGHQTHVYSALPLISCLTLKGDLRPAFNLSTVYLSALKI